MTETDKQLEGLMQEVHHLANQAEALAYENYTLKKTIEELEKENEELKWERKQILEDDDNYQKENEELYEIIKKLQWIQAENIHLKAQIEKMKCCENCKHHNVACSLDEYCENGWDKWELAE